MLRVKYLSELVKKKKQAEEEEKLRAEQESEKQRTQISDRNDLSSEEISTT